MAEVCRMGIIQAQDSRLQAKSSHSHNLSISPNRYDQTADHILRPTESILVVPPRSKPSMPKEILRQDTILAMLQVQQ